MPHPLPATGSVSIGVGASPGALWPLISDPAVPAQFSAELQRASFLEGGRAAVGAVIEGHNANGPARWTTRSDVVTCEAPRRFAWATGGADAPVATWSFDVAAADGGATLTHTVVLHDGVPPLAPAIAAEPDRADEIVQSRLTVLLASMLQTVSGIAAMAERRERGE